MLTSGSLFSGYLGLSTAVTQVFGAQLRWVSDIEQFDKKGSRIGNAPLILRHRAPGVPNLGDITSIDWSRVEPVTVIDGGSPCQDVSLSGKRAGMTEGTRSNLWVAMREAIAVLKPTFVVWENVRGVLSARADSAVEPCAGCLGDGGAEPHLRALGRVLGDLADLGFDAEWEGLRAADIGAPHGRYRIFVLAAHPERVARLQWEYQPGPFGAFAETARRDRASVTAVSRCGRRRQELYRRFELLPTPRATRGGSGTETVNLLPSAVMHQYGKYQAAIERWEQVVGRVAPAPTEPGSNGGQRLSPRFVEWLMGCPDGWVTDVPGLTRNQQMHALGNGVVTQQAVEALLRMILRILDVRRAA